MNLNQCIYSKEITHELAGLKLTIDQIMNIVLDFKPEGVDYYHHLCHDPDAESDAIRLSNTFGNHADGGGVIFILREFVRTAEHDNPVGFYSNRVCYIDVNAVMLLRLLKMRAFL